MRDKESSRYYVELEYSADYLNDQKVRNKTTRLRKGEDPITSKLKQQGVPFTIFFASDFRYSEPILLKATQKGKDGNIYDLYNYRKSSCFQEPIPSHYILDYLISLGVIKNERNK
jgi:hypothetical protein